MPQTLEHLVLSGSYQWQAAPPATPAALADLIAAQRIVLPPLYRDLLRLSDGGDGFFAGEMSYIRVWSAALAVDYNRDYEIARYAPGFVGFGDNGGPEIISFDTRGGEPYPIVAIPFVPMAWDDALPVAPDLDTMLQRLVPVDRSPH